MLFVLLFSTVLYILTPHEIQQWNKKYCYRLSWKKSNPLNKRVVQTSVSKPEAAFIPGKNVKACLMCFTWSRHALKVWKNLNATKKQFSNKSLLTLENGLSKYDIAYPFKLIPLAPLKGSNKNKETRNIFSPLKSCKFKVVFLCRMLQQTWDMMVTTLMRGVSLFFKM